MSVLASILGDVPNYAADAPPLTGRDDDLERLESLLLDDGGHVLVSGDAGIGKTRLLTELAERASARGWTVLVGHCVGEAGASLPYLPFSEVLAEVVRDPAAQERLSGTPLARLVPGGAPGTGGPGEPVDRAGLFSAVHLALEELAADGPVLLVVEDVHWADESSRDLLTMLLTRGFRGPVSLALSYRSDDLHRRHPLQQTLVVWSRITGLHRLDLQPLERDQMSTFIHGIPRLSLREDQVADVVERAEGNAFFAEELAAAYGGGRGGTSNDLSRLLLSRVEQLPEPDQRLVRLASAAGRRVGHRLLEAVAELAPDELEDALRRAIEHHVLLPFGGDGYVFRHALLAETVYDDLLPGERVRAHAAFAAALTADPSLGTPADLARHAAAAGDRALAARASVEAGDAAMRVGGPAEALHHYETALALTTEEEALDELTQAASRAATAVGRLDRAMGLLRCRLDLPEGTTSRRSRAEILAQLAFVARLTEEDVDRLRLTEEGLALVPEEGPARARLLGLRAEALMDADSDEEAAQVADGAMELAVKLDLRAVQSDLNAVIARLAERGGDPQESLRRLESVVSTWGETTDLALLRAKHQLGGLHYRQGRPHEAIQTYLNAVQRARQVGLQWAPYGADARVMAAAVAYESGDWDLSARLALHVGENAPEAQAAALDAVGLAVAVARGRPIPDEMMRRIRRQWSTDGLVAIHSAPAVLEACGLAGDLDGARRVRSEFVDFLRTLWNRKHNDVEVRINALLLGHLASAAAVLPSSVRAGLRVEGSELLTEGMAVWPPGAAPGPGLEGRAWRSRLQAEALRLEWLAGGGVVTANEVVAAWAETAELFRERFDIYEWARSATRQAACLVAAGRDEEAVPLVEEGRSVAERLGAMPLLHELDGIHLGRTLPGRASEASGVGSTQLTPRELEVLHLLEQGRSNGQIGTTLFISTKTASVHVSNILAKLGAANRGEAVAIARTKGVLTP